jgi:formylmethanofuran dehydrogenase subunit E-like metal-binding protein
MNEQTKKLANIWANRRAEDNQLGITYTFSEKALDVFAEQVRAEHTQSVIKLCANTINNNLNAEKQRRSNRWDNVNLVLIIIGLIAWAAWWYTQFH